MTVAAAVNTSDNLLVPVVAGWWVLAIGWGFVIGRGSRTNQSIERLLAGARAATSLPEQRPGTVLVNRLWPLLVATVASVVLAFVFPQVPGILAGFAMAFSTALRHQEKAVSAIEERDGAAFYVERTHWLRPIQLVRTPSFRRDVAPVL